MGLPGILLFSQISFAKCLLFGAVLVFLGSFPESSSLISGISNATFFSTVGAVVVLAVFLILLVVFHKHRKEKRPSQHNQRTLSRKNCLPQEGMLFCDCLN